MQDIDIKALQSLLRKEGMVIDVEKIKDFHDYDYLREGNDSEYDRMYKYYNVKSP